ncbi:MAG TPA: hypothetical protein VGB67_17390, partial [Fibrella sp.]
RNEQLGNDNTALISQLGNANIVKGVGGDNIARQSGTMNQLTVDQTGNVNTANLSQIGMGNGITVTQSSN